MSEISISSIINISVSNAGAGVPKYNTSNLLCLTHETPVVQHDVGEYPSYSTAAAVGADWGTDSRTYLAALKVFSQQPNILANRGLFIVGRIQYQITSLSFSAVATAGHIKLVYGGEQTASIPFGSLTAAGIQAALRLVPTLQDVLVEDVTISNPKFLVKFEGVYGHILLSSTDNTLTDAGSAAVNLTVSDSANGANVQQTIGQAIEAASSAVQFLGVGACLSSNEMEIGTSSGTDQLAAAEIVQGLNKIFILSDFFDSGVFGNIVDANYTYTRPLLYGLGGSNQNALDFQWAYAGRAFSVIFDGSNTTITMHLKDLVGILPDTTISAVSNTLDYDCYPSIQGVGKVFCSGKNKFFDDVYDYLWFIGALQVSLFNLLAQTSTKIVQTESGVDTLKGSIRKVCEQAVANQYLAAGSWTSPDTFGVQSDFFANILQKGYYIYSQPVALQDSADRADRKAPLIQIAIKQAGAIQSADLLIYVNA
jgi:hypothetical protein